MWNHRAAVGILIIFRDQYDQKYQWLYTSVPVFAIICILCTKYLVSTSTYVYLPYVNCQLTICSVVYRPNIDKVIDCYIHVHFAGGWAQVDSDYAKNVISRSG